jgi:hypothetical protein
MILQVILIFIWEKVVNLEVQEQVVTGAILTVAIVVIAVILVEMVVMEEGMVVAEIKTFFLIIKQFTNLNLIT